LKTCTKCLEEKTLESFYNRKAASDGKTSWCKSCYAERKRLYYAKNSESINKRHYEWFKNLPEERKKPYKDSAKFRQSTAYRSKRNAIEAGRRFKKLKATPQWLTEAQVREIESFYWLAKDLKSVSGQDYHVDHIVPLKGKDVCGLHVPWNLQVLPSDINISKSNTHYEGEYK
jgi:hypothetical protein